MQVLTAAGGPGEDTIAPCQCWGHYVALRLLAHIPFSIMDHTKAMEDRKWLFQIRVYKGEWSVWKLPLFSSFGISQIMENMCVFMDPFRRMNELSHSFKEQCTKSQRSHRYYQDCENFQRYLLEMQKSYMYVFRADNVKFNTRDVSLEYTESFSFRSH